METHNNYYSFIIPRQEMMMYVLAKFYYMYKHLLLHIFASSLLKFYLLTLTAMVVHLGTITLVISLRCSQVCFPIFLIIIFLFFTACHCTSAFLHTKSNQVKKVNVNCIC